MSADDQTHAETADREYVLRTSDAELARLGFQHRLWAESACGIWERAGVGPGKTVLDLGAGPGYTSTDLGRLTAPDGRVIAVDQSQRFIDSLCRRLDAEAITNVEPRVGDVQTLDLPPGAIDIAYARWVLCFVADPEAVISRLAESLPPGGVVAIQDYYNYEGIFLAPTSDAFRRAVRAVARSWAARGGDANIASRLPGMLHRRGFEVREIRPLVRLARPGSALWRWPETFFRNFLPVLVEENLLTQADQHEFLREWEQRAADPGALFTTPPMLEIIAVKR